ncbi:MAG: ATP-binding cassette domain-containing protein [Desulfovibrio sp.]|nr:ATP-binding cassette domain-containing protein [Desulfovibrio sp.]
MPQTAVLTLQGVAKFYGDKLIFRNLNFSAMPGRLYLILGSNGSGKSTLLRIMAGLAKPEAGLVNKAAGLRISYLGHATFLYNHLTAMQNLRFWSRAQGLGLGDAELSRLLEKVELGAYAHEKARIFSRGMAQRLNFARCLLQRPRLLLLDEPFTGLDSRSQALLASELAALKQDDTCIMLVSHAPQADGKLADHIYTISERQLQEKMPC